MKKTLLGLAALTLLCATATPAGVLEPAVQEVLATGSVPAPLPVIIQFREQVDVEAVRREARQVAREMYPDDPKKRKQARRKLVRKMLVKALKHTARDSGNRVRRFLKANGANPKLKLLWVRNAVVGEVPGGLLEGLAGLPEVDRIILDVTIQGPGTGMVPTAPTYWNLDATGAPVVWLTGNTGQDVVVATLDTGADATHPDLGPRWRGGDNSWFDPYGEHASPADVNGHGTRVLGLIVGGDAGGIQVGMAPGAQWIAAKIFDDANQATLSGIHEAFQWVLDPDRDPLTDDAPDIVNNSWDLANSVNQCIQEFAPDIALLQAAEIAVAFAGGNYGPEPDSSVSPANDPAVISVGAVDFLLAVDVLSSRGANACDGGIYPHTVAPGDGVWTTDLMPGFYNIVSGTSFAVPHVAGGMAVLKSAFPEATVSELEAAIIDSAADLGPVGPDNDYGFGLIDLVEAYARLEANQGETGSGEIQFSASAYGVDENVASLSVTVTRTGGSAGDVAVDYATADGTATAGQDYEATAGNLVFADGEVNASFAVPILDDAVYEGDEDFTLTLSNVQGGASLGTPVSATVTVLEDEQPDSDADGVTDGLDLCPETPAGDSVDADGCSASQRDSDGDGVSDALDQCPDTPAGETVDAEGCSASQRDADGDGVNDALDQCPDTPAGETVDAEGCAASQRDGDGDGVSDALDQCPGTPAGEAVDAAGCSASQRDTDGDGISDALDQCPDTPAGASVDANGCTVVVLDSDGDGVSDGLDQCPGTPAGESVDASGCAASQLDSDGDGISDALDQCPGTPAGESVDASGCSASQLDSDGDGVSDGLDQCPGTPAGESVDTGGCSASQLDADADGVSDALDQCPGTPAGETVDANGCAPTQLDSDADGVSDALDQCPNTPAGEAVDVNGCAASQLDSDGDGVTDDLDQCSDTPPDQEVDASGCPVSKPGGGGGGGGGGKQSLLFSSIGGGDSNPVPDIVAPYDDADIYADDGVLYSRLVDATLDLGLPGNADLDGLYLVDEDTFYLSFNRDGGTAVPGLGTVQDEDVVFYDAGNWSLFFDGSVCGLDAVHTQDVDAIHLETGVLYFSTLGGGNGNPVAGVDAPYDDADVYTWSPGATRCGRVFDASQNGLPSAADIDGLSARNGIFYMSFNRNGGTTVPGVGSVQDESVVSYDGTMWSLYFAGEGLGTTNGQDIDAVHVP